MTRQPHTPSLIQFPDGVQAMFHGGPLDGERRMLPDAWPHFAVIVKGAANWEVRYERERLTPQVTNAAANHEVALRYFWPGGRAR